MRSLYLAVLLLASGCSIPVTFVPSTPQSTSRNGGIEASVPHGRDARREGAAACAQYGRVARYSHRDSGRAIYECVDPASAAQDE